MAAPSSPPDDNSTLEVTRGYESFTAWDETYVHERAYVEPSFRRGTENHGRGSELKAGARLLYRFGHDHRVWDQPNFHDLLKRAVYWAVGDEARGKLAALKLPEFEMIDVQLPGYIKRKLVTKVPKPFSPEESIKLAQVPPGFELSLFASEPEIVNPIYIAWDHKGRFVVTIGATTYRQETSEMIASRSVRIPTGMDGLTSSQFLPISFRFPPPWSSQTVESSVRMVQMFFSSRTPTEMTWLICGKSFSPVSAQVTPTPEPPTSATG